MSRTATFTPEQDAELLRLNAVGVSIRMLARLRRETPSAVQRAIGRERKRIEQTEHEQKTAAADRRAAQAILHRPAPKPPPEVIPDELGELVTRGFRPSGEGVWRSPGGVVVKMKKQGKNQKESWKFEELVFEGSIIATRAGEGIKVKAGDVEITPTKDGYEVQLAKK